MLKAVKRELKKWENMIRIMDNFKLEEPEGFLNYQEKNDRIFYYHMIKNQDNGQREKKYIKKKEIEFAKKLAQKSYYSRVRIIAKKNKAELERFIRHYDWDGLDTAYDELPDIRKSLIAPIFGSREYEIKRWNEERKENMAPHQEARIYITEQGELVRSKSEVIIANLLYQKKDELKYVYEDELVLKVGTKKVVLHPDFKVLNLRTGKIAYWEHMGMMDNAHYANEFVTKVNTYINNGYMPGRDVLFTFESSGIPLDTRTVKGIIDKFLYG